MQWLPELDRGIPYLDLIDEGAIHRVHDASAWLLEDVGIEFRDDECLAYWREAGATATGQRVRVDRAHLMELVRKAPAQYTIHARNPERSVTLGGRKAIFTPACGSPYVRDLDDRRRAATIRDFNDFAKLAHLSPAMHMSGGVLCEPTDTASRSERPFAVKCTARCSRWKSAAPRLVSKDRI